MYTSMASKRAHTLHFKDGNELHGIGTRMLRKCKMTLKMQPSAITDPPWMQQPIVQGRSVRDPYDSNVAHL